MSNGKSHLESHSKCEMAVVLLAIALLSPTLTLASTRDSTAGVVDTSPLPPGALNTDILALASSMRQRWVFFLHPCTLDSHTSKANVLRECLYQWCVLRMLFFFMVPDAS